MLYSVDLTVLFLAVPSLTADLQPSSAQLLWIVDIYGFMLAGSLITMGTLLAAARDAFTLGFQVTALTSAVIAAATAVLIAVFLRHVRAGSEAERPLDIEPRRRRIPPVATELE